MVRRFSIGGTKRRGVSPPLTLLISILAMFSLALSACDSNSQSQIDVNVTPMTTGAASAGTVAPTTTRPLVGPSAVPTLAEPGNTVVDMAVAWGAQLNVTSIPNAIGEDRILGPLVPTQDGKFLLAVIQTREWGEQGGLEPGKVVLIDLATKHVQEIKQLPTNDTQAFGASADNDWLVWAEAPQEPNFFSNWSLYAYQISTRTLKEVAKAPRGADGQLLRGPDIWVKVDHGIAVWAEAPTVQKESVRGVVKNIDLQSGTTQVLADNGLTPAISWPHVAWIEGQNEPSKQIEGANKGLIVLYNMQSGSKKTLSGPDTPSYFDIHNNLVSWITAKGDEVLLTDLAESYQRTIARIDTAQPNRFEEAYLNDRLVTWYSRTEAQIWDLKKDIVVTLDDQPVGYKQINGNAIVWMSPVSEQAMQTPLPDNKRSIYVLDTSKLPK
jgi:hypothetical protein